VSRPDRLICHVLPRAFLMALTAEGRLAMLEHCADASAKLTIVAGQVRSRGGTVAGFGADDVTRMQQHRARARAWRDGVADGERTNLDSIS